MSEPLDIRHLRYFLAVAEAGSFSRAADRLGISQPSVSQQMRDLEAALRVPLFQRRGKRILLTPRGLIFQEHARALLHQIENLLHELNGEPGELRGALRLGVIPVLNVPLVPLLFLSVGIETFAVQREDLGWAASYDTTVGLRLHLDSAYQQM